jgi:hypothetical protein
MSANSIGWTVLTCVFGGALLGMALRLMLPEHHLSADSKDVIKLAMGLTATMSALVLALLIASAKGSYDAQRNEITQLSANVVLLNRMLIHYGPETKDARQLLRDSVSDMTARIWPQENSRPAALDSTRGDALFDEIQGLSPKNDGQRTLQEQALRMVIDLAQTRLLLLEQGGSSIPKPFLMLLVFWVTIIFLSFGLFAPRNATVIATLLLCALSVSGAIFLILELDQPFMGIIQISSAPMHSAAIQIGR